MLRKILILPNRPAVVLMHSYAWMHVSGRLLWGGGGSSCARTPGLGQPGFAVAVVVVGRLAPGDVCVG